MWVESISWWLVEKRGDQQMGMEYNYNYTLKERGKRNKIR